MFRLGLTRVRTDDEVHVRLTILPAVEETANRITVAWERESDRLTRPYVESGPELHQDIGNLAQVLAMKEVLEHLRFELFGRNSFVDHRPHPHSGRGRHTGNRTSEALPERVRGGHGVQTREPVTVSPNPPKG